MNYHWPGWYMSTYTQLLRTHIVGTHTYTPAHIPRQGKNIKVFVVSKQVFIILYTCDTFVLCVCVCVCVCTKSLFVYVYKSILVTCFTIFIVFDCFVHTIYLTAYVLCRSITEPAAKIEKNFFHMHPQWFITVCSVFWPLFPTTILPWKYCWGEHSSPHIVVKVIIGKHIEVTQNGQEHHHVAC